MKRTQRETRFLGALRALLLTRDKNSAAARARAQAVALVLLSIITSSFCAGTPTASWYSHASTLTEGNSGFTTSGDKLDDAKLTCATWDYPIGTKVKVVNLNNHKSVVCTVTDRGPARWLVKKGRIIDLSRSAFERLAPLSDGAIPVSVEALK